MDQSLPIALLRAREAVMAPIRAMLSESGVTEQQWRVLRALSEAGPADASTVADRASLLFPSLTRIAVSMREKGLITQSRDTVDRRRQVLDITPKGQAIIDRNLSEAQLIVGQYKAKLGDADFKVLISLLNRLSTDD